MAKIDLGRISPTYRGNYDSTVSYNELDIVYDDTIGKSFIAKQASKGKDLPVDKENEYWGIIAKQGPKGTAGEVGPKGDKGAAGDQGIQGERGPKGDQGDQGPRGPQGIQGDQGVAGIDATFDENKDYSFKGTVSFLKKIAGSFKAPYTSKTLSEIMTNLNENAGVWSVNPNVTTDSPEGAWGIISVQDIDSNGNNGYIMFIGSATDIFYYASVQSGKIRGPWHKVADDSKLVHKTGDETVYGNKQLLGDITVGNLYVNGGMSSK